MSEQSAIPFNSTIQFFKKTVLKNIRKFSGKYLCLLKKFAGHEFCKIFMNTFFIEHLKVTANYSNYLGLEK